MWQAISTRQQPASLAAGLILFQMLALLLIGAHAIPTLNAAGQRDLWLYYTTSAFTLHGQMPYRDFPLEYPPFALFPFALPRVILLCHRLLFSTYLWAFLIESVVFSTILAVVLWKLARRHHFPLSPSTALAVYAALAISVSLMLPWRYDLFPALLTALALAAVLGKRPAIAGLCLGLAIAAKLYPAVLLPVFALYYLADQRPKELLPLLVACGGAIVLCVLPFVTLPPDVFLSFLKYHELRGLEIESLPAGIILLSHALGRTPAGVVYNYGALHLVAPGAAQTIRLLPALFLALYSLLLLRCRNEFQNARRAGGIPPELLVRFLMVALLTFIVTNKVFSPQYVLWLLPFAPLLRPRQAAVVLLVFVLTTIDYPLTFPHLTAMETPAILLINLRNFLVFALMGMLLAEPKKAPVGEAVFLPSLEKAHV